MEFILSGSKDIKSTPHCSSQGHFVCVCNQLNSSVLSSSNYCKLEQQKKGPFTCPNVGDGVPLPECHKIPTFLSFPHDMPSRRGQVKTTWISSGECFILIGFDFDDKFCFVFAFSLEAIQCLVPLAWLYWM